MSASHDEMVRKQKSTNTSRRKTNTVKRSKRKSSTVKSKKFQQLSTPSAAMSSPINAKAIPFAAFLLIILAALIINIVPTLMQSTDNLTGNADATSVNSCDVNDICPIYVVVTKDGEQILLKREGTSYHSLDPEKEYSNLYLNKDSSVSEGYAIYDGEDKVDFTINHLTDDSGIPAQDISGYKDTPNNVQTYKAQKMSTFQPSSDSMYLENGLGQKFYTSDNGNTWFTEDGTPVADPNTAVNLKEKYDQNLASNIKQTGSTGADTFARGPTSPPPPPPSADASGDGSGTTTGTETYTPGKYEPIDGLEDLEGDESNGLSLQNWVVGDDTEAFIVLEAGEVGDTIEGTTYSRSADGTWYAQTDPNDLDQFRTVAEGSDEEAALNKAYQRELQKLQDSNSELLNNPTFASYLTGPSSSQSSGDDYIRDGIFFSTADDNTQMLFLESGSFDNIKGDEIYRFIDGKWIDESGKEVKGDLRKQLVDASKGISVQDNYIAVSNPADGSTTYYDKDGNAANIIKEFKDDVQIPRGAEIEITGDGIEVDGIAYKTSFNQEMGVSTLETTIIGLDGEQNQKFKTYLLPNGEKMRSTFNDKDKEIVSYGKYSGSYQEGAASFTLKDGDKELIITPSTDEKEKSKQTKFEYSGGKDARTVLDYENQKVRTYNTRMEGSDGRSGTITTKSVDSKGNVQFGKTYNYDSQGTTGNLITDNQGTVIAISKQNEIPKSSPETDTSKYHYVSTNGKKAGRLVGDPSDGISEEDIQEINCGTDCDKMKTTRRTQFLVGNVASGIDQLGSTQFFSSLLNLDNGAAKLFGFDSLESWDRWFSGTILAEGYFESLVCASKYPDIQGADSLFVDTGNGFQGVGSVNAEIYNKLNPEPVLCYNNEDGEAACAISGFECDDQGTFCLDEDGDNVMGYQYQISWGVKSPEDQSLTPYTNENGYAISYNIVAHKQLIENGDSSALNGCADDITTLQSRFSQTDNGPDCVPIYVDAVGNTKNPLLLVNGEADGQTLVMWSTKNNYQSVCIKWTEAPLTYYYGVGANSLGNLFGQNPGNYPTRKDMGKIKGDYPVPDFCTEVVDLSQGTVGLEYLPGYESKSAVVSSSPDAGYEQSSVTTSQIGTVGLG